MLTVLVADDQPPIRELVRYTLEGEPIRVVEAADGDAALDAARSVCPDLILLDVHIPGLSGLEVCRRLRQDPRLQRARIIMLTMLEDDASVFNAMRVGARGYLLKGADPQEVLSVIRAVADPSGVDETADNDGPAVVIVIVAFNYLAVYCYAGLIG